MNRRAFLAASVSGVGPALAGCVLGDTVSAGALVISNDHVERHAIAVTVRKVSDDDGDVPPRPHEAPAPTAEPRWERRSTFEVPAGGRTVESDFVTEVGAFHVAVSLDTGETASTWLGLYAAGRDGGQIAESHVWVAIGEDGRVTVSTPVDD